MRIQSGKCSDCRKRNGGKTLYIIFKQVENKVSKETKNSEKEKAPIKMTKH